MRKSKQLESFTQKENREKRQLKIISRSPIYCIVEGGQMFSNFYEDFFPNLMRNFYKERVKLVYHKRDLGWVEAATGKVRFMKVLQEG